MLTYPTYKHFYEVFIRPSRGAPIRIWHYQHSYRNLQNAHKLAHAVSSWCPHRVEIWTDSDDIQAAYYKGMEVSTHAQRGYE